MSACQLGKNQPILTVHSLTSRMPARVDSNLQESINWK